MEALYRGYRIVLKQDEKWIARITEPRGTRVSINASASLAEGPDRCMARAREMIDRYVGFLANSEIDDGSPE